MLVLHPKHDFLFVEANNPNSAVMAASRVIIL
jgi:hypothetical protein